MGIVNLPGRDPFAFQNPQATVSFMGQLRIGQCKNELDIQQQLMNISSPNCDTAVPAA